jgi:hypothetical protein
VVVAACAISAGIHAALVPGHLDESAGAGIAFLGSAVVLGGLALALTLGVGPRVVVATALTLAALLAAYALAITAGVPMLHPATEPVTGLAVATKAVEAVGLAAAAHLVLRRHAPALLRTERKLT